MSIILTANRDIIKQTKQALKIIFDNKKRGIKNRFF